MSLEQDDISVVRGRPLDTWNVGDAVGRYTLMAMIAKGGMAEIWLARQQGPRGFAKVVVIKRIVDSLSHDADFVEMFLDEARIAAQLSHPNIVQIYDLGEHAGAWYIAMEYLPGENVSALMRTAIRAKMPLSIAVIAKIVAGAAEGLAHAHAKAGTDGKPLNIVHRDVSPQNILVTYDGQVKVVDFGIAKAANRGTNTSGGQIKGKFSYMSPEQAQGQHVDRRSDVFALGVLLYEMLTRTRLFYNTDQYALLSQIISPEPVPPPHTRNPAIPIELSNIVSKAVAKSVSERYQSAQAFHHALEEWLRAQGAPPSTAELGAIMHQLFAEHIRMRAQLIDSATRGELTPASAKDGLHQDTQQSMPGHTGLARRWRAMAALAGGVLALVVLFAVVRSNNSTSVEPPVKLTSTSVKTGSGLGTGTKVAAVRPEVSTRTEMRVDTEPKGAAVTVDGKLIGVAPVTLDDIALGEHQISASLEGRRTASRSVTLNEPGRTTAVLLSLSPEAAPALAVRTPSTSKAAPKGRLTMSTTPWTQVVLNGRALGDTPLVEIPLPAGRHMLKLVNEEKNINRTVEVEIKSGQTTVKKLSL